MSDDNSIGLASMALENISHSSSITKFHKFPELPPEIRVLIWKHSFQPRRIILMRAGDRPPMSLASSAALLFVSLEAKYVFDTHYIKCFHELGQKGIRFNFDIDTLCFNTSLKGLRKMIRQYPMSMSRVKFIDVKSLHRAHLEEKILSINLTPLQSLKKLTIRWNLGEYRKRYNYLRPIGVISTFEHLRGELQQAAEANIWEKNKIPTIALILNEHDLPWTAYWCDTYHISNGPMYLESGKDLQHASYGRIPAGADTFGDFQVDWLVRDVLIREQYLENEHPQFPQVFGDVLDAQEVCVSLKLLNSLKPSIKFEKYRRRRDADHRIRLHEAWVKRWLKQTNATEAVREVMTKNVKDRKSLLESEIAIDRWTAELWE